MRWIEPVRYVMGSTAIYAVMVACSGVANGPLGGGPGAGSGSGAASASGSASASGAASGSGSASGASSGSSSSGSSSGIDPTPDANADTTQSGSRLKAAYYVGGDGSKQFAYWKDSARGGETCAFALAGDGATRCLPTQVAWVETGYFVDASCTQTLAYAYSGSGCSAPPQYAASYETSACGSREHLFSLGGAASSVYVKSGASCVATSFGTPGELQFFRVGGEIAAGSFQDATVDVE